MAFTLRTDDHQEALLDDVRRAVGATTRTQGIWAALAQFIALRNDRDRLRERIDELSRRLEEAKRIMREQRECEQRLGELRMQRDRYFLRTDYTAKGGQQD